MNLAKTKWSIDHEVLTALAYVVMLALASLVRTRLNKAMNEAHSCIQFEIEKPTITPRGKSLSLLDFTVTITEDGNAKFEFFKKQAKKPIFMHYKSALPKRAKLHAIRNERKRIDQRCSTQASKDIHQQEFTTG